MLLVNVFIIQREKPDESFLDWTFLFKAIYLLLSKYILVIITCTIYSNISSLISIIIKPFATLFDKKNIN